MQSAILASNFDEDLSFPVLDGFVKIAVLDEDGGIRLM